VHAGARMERADFFSPPIAAQITALRFLRPKPWDGGSKIQPFDTAIEKKDGLAQSHTCMSLNTLGLDTTSTKTMYWNTHFL
jgi:hypothetical protein